MNNRHAAIDSKSVEKIRLKAKALAKAAVAGLNPREETIWELITKTNNATQTIESCDLPTDPKDNAVMVNMAHKKIDIIFDNEQISFLEKIITAASYVKKTGYGNCQEKAYVAFATMLYNTFHEGYNTAPVKLELAYFKNHFIVLVDDRFLLDPWLNIAFPFKQSEKQSTLKTVFNNFGTLKTFFTVEQPHGYSWLNCAKYQTTESYQKPSWDDESTGFLFDYSDSGCVAMLKAKGLFDLSKIDLSENSNTKKRKASGDLANVTKDIRLEPSVVASGSSTMFAPAQKQAKNVEPAGQQVDHIFQI